MKQSIDEDVKTLHSMGYAQELARRMSGFSNFAISFSIICILAGGITSFPQALSTGLGFQVFVGWIVGAGFALVVALCLGQIGSAYPTAGGLYHWSSIFGGRGWGWATAWFNLIGLLFVVASVNVGVWYLFRDLVLAGVFHLDVSSLTVDPGRDSNAHAIGAQIVVVALITTAQALANHFGIKLTTMLTDFSGYLIFVVVILLTATFLTWGATWDFSRLFTFVNMTGEAGGGLIPEPRAALIAFLIGLLYPLYTITGFDASAHTAEETHNARVAVPRGMLHAVFWSLLFGLLMAASFVLASPDLAAMAKEGGSAWFNLFNALPAPTLLKNFLAIAIVVANFICALAALTSTSRMIFAFARDGGLPGSRLWRHVSARWRTPVAAIWFGAGCSFAATLYSPAFSALAAGCALFIYISYAMPIAAGFFAEGKSWTQFGPFRLGVWSKPLAALSSAGVLVLIYAGIQPPSDIVIDYIVGIGVFLTLLWFGLERRRFKGPPIGAEITRRAHEIEAAEEAVGELTPPPSPPSPNTTHPGPQTTSPAAR